MSTTLEPGAYAPRGIIPYSTQDAVELRRGQGHAYFWDESEYPGKKKLTTIATGERVRLVLKWWDLLRWARIRYRLNGAEIETHTFVADGNFAFDLCPEPTPDHPGDIIGKFYRPGGPNQFFIENLGPGSISIPSLFVYRAWILD